MNEDLLYLYYETCRWVDLHVEIRDVEERSMGHFITLVVSNLVEYQR